MRVIANLGAAALVVLSVAGCATQPIMNVNDSVVATAQGKPASKEQVHAAIVSAGGALGWQMKDGGPDKIVGTLVLRGHTAVVDIPYSANKYSILYRSSVNLNESGGQIHKNYNGWIQNLSRGINTQVGLL